MFGFAGSRSNAVRSTEKKRGVVAMSWWGVVEKFGADTRERNVQKAPDPAPPKPLLFTFEVFEGATPGVFPIIHAAGQAAPEAPLFEKAPTPEPTKPTKPTFEGSTPGEEADAEAFLIAVRRREVTFSLREDGRVQVSNIPSDLVTGLQARWDELEPLLRDPANPFSLTYRFPSCPACGSYVGDYQCMTCELTGISENQARRIDEEKQVKR